MKVRYRVRELVRVLERYSGCLVSLLDMVNVGIRGLFRLKNTPSPPDILPSVDTCFFETVVKDIIKFFEITRLT